MHGCALKDGEEDLGDVVGKDYKGEAPEEGGKARNGAEDAVEEEKCGVLEGGGSNTVEHFHCYDGLGVCCWVFEENDVFSCSKMYRVKARSDLTHAYNQGEEDHVVIGKYSHFAQTASEQA